MNKKLFPFIAMAALMAFPSEAKVRLPHVICDNMVIQQNADVNLWGWDKPGKDVKVSVSWSDDVYTAKTGKDGRWSVSVKSPKASYTPLSITFDDGEKTTVNDVLAGEVWVCTGQSNMEMPINGFGNCPVEGANDVKIDAAKVKGINFVKIPSVMSMTPLDDADCKWEKVSPATVGDCSATGYFFGETLNKALDIPIGLILANKGGSRVESWLDYDNLKKHTTEEVDDSAKMVKKFEWDYHRPLVWGNGTVHPILNYTVNGIIYYQGCSNVGDPGNQYSDRLKILVEQWRRDFRNENLPFYFVEIAPYNYGSQGLRQTGALLREQQLRASDIIPNSALVCTNDLAYPFETTQIHPRQKKPVGDRLAYHALKRNYGFDKLISDSPRYKSMEVSNDSVFVSFDHMDWGYDRFEDIQGFEIAGDDKVFYPAKAVHFWEPGNNPRNETVLLTAPEVKHPVAVRYCFKDFQLGNLKNAGLLPLFPFRTDNWE